MILYNCDDERDFPSLLFETSKTEYLLKQQLKNDNKSFKVFYVTFQMQVNSLSSRIDGLGATNCGLSKYAPSFVCQSENSVRRGVFRIPTLDENGNLVTLARPMPKHLS